MIQSADPPARPSKKKWWPRLSKCPLPHKNEMAPKESWSEMVNECHGSGSAWFWQDYARPCKCACNLRELLLDNHAWHQKPESWEFYGNDSWPWNNKETIWSSYVYLPMFGLIFGGEEREVAVNSCNRSVGCHTGIVVVLKMR